MLSGVTSLAGGVTLSRRVPSGEEWRHLVQASTSLLQLGPLLAWGMAKGYDVGNLHFLMKSVKPFATYVATTHRGLFPLPVDLAFFKEAELPTTGCDRAVCEQAWTNLVALALNLLHGEVGPFPTTRRSLAVKKSLEVIALRVRRFFNQETSPGASIDDIWENVKNKHINYNGEEVAIACPLSVAQVEDSMPPLGHGGSVELAPLLTGYSRYLIEHPEAVLLPEHLPVPGSNTARVHVKRGDEIIFFKLLKERGVVDFLPTPEVFGDSQGPYLSGLFGIPKPGRYTKDHLPVLRLIMNLIPINRVLRIIYGDILSLPSAAYWQQLVLAEGERNFPIR